jgi:hypothetical protein
MADYAWREPPQLTYLFVPKHYSLPPPRFHHRAGLEIVIGSLSVESERLPWSRCAFDVADQPAR